MATRRVMASNDLSGSHEGWLGGLGLGFGFVPHRCSMASNDLSVRHEGGPGWV